MRRAVVIVIMFAVSALAKNRKDIPLAPLPTQIVQAKKVFLSNGGGSDLAYDAFYAAMKSWGRYSLTDKPEDADIIVELSYRVVDEGTRVWSATNTYTKQTQVYSSHDIDPQLNLAIYDPKTKMSLWSTTEHRRLARREKNREKETVNAAQRLVDNLKQRIEDATKQP